MCRKAGHLDILEAVEGEARRPHLLAAAFEDIGVNLARFAQVFGHQRAVVVKHLTEAQRDLRARRTRDTQPDTARQVLANVEDVYAVLRRRNSDGPQFLRGPHRHAGVGLERPGILQHCRCRRPGHVIETGRVPAGHVAARVMGLTHLQVVGADGAGGGFPVLAGGHHRACAVRVLDFQLRQQPGRFAVIRTARSLAGQQAEADVARVPAAPENGARGVVAFAQQVRHVVGVVVDPLVVIRPARCKKVLAHALAVDRKLVKPQRRGVERRAAHRLIRGKRLAQIGAWRQHQLRVFVFAGGVVPDPARLPISIFEQAHCPQRRVAPRGYRVRAVPHHHLPMAAHPRRERRARIDHRARLATRYLARVPQVTRVRREFFGRARYEDAVGVLRRPAFLGRHNPAQAWRGLADAQRVHAVFATQQRRRQTVRGCANRQCGQGRQCQHAQFPVHARGPFLNVAGTPHILPAIDQRIAKFVTV